MVREKVDALCVAPGTLFNARRVQLAALAARHDGVPAVYAGRDYVVAGGLMSYGSDIANAHRQVGLYTARILKGAHPAELPVLQSAKFELVINLSIARALGAAIPDKLLALADETAKWAKVVKFASIKPD